MKQSTEFSGFARMEDPGLALGVVRGARSFAVDKLGRLTGVTIKDVWRPGENVAVCRKDASALNPPRYSMFASLFGGPVEIDEDHIDSDYLMETFMSAKAPVHYHDSFHAAAEKYKHEKELKKIQDKIWDCSHGFHGYYEGSDDYYQRSYVSGVIEGYGETVIGTRGFRSSKARIVALQIPKRFPQSHEKLIRRNYSEIPIFTKFNHMLSEFPPDANGLGISPETDPEFWTRPE